MILITGKTYDALKYLAQVILPALGTLYFALAGIWGLPSAQEIVGTIVALDTFLGVVLHLSSTAYAKSDARFDGSVDIHQTADKKVITLDVGEKVPYDIERMDHLLLKVNKPNQV